MFGLFGKKDRGVKVFDKIWMSEEAKFKACLQLKQNDPEVVFIAWFEEAKTALQNYFKANNLPDAPVYLADRLNGSIADKPVIFIEHHPLHAEEQRIAKTYGLNELTVYSALTEPIFKLFRSDEIIEMLKKMGIGADEMIEHGMISSSIKTAQQKIASRIEVNSSSRSQGDWLLNAGLNGSFP